MFYPELSEEFGEWVETLRGKRVAVVGHARPDGDCIGSQVALSRTLRHRGVDTVCVNQDAVPRRLEFVALGEPFREPGEWLKDGWVAVTVDCADVDRAGEWVQAIGQGFEANIDHHISNTRYARRNFVDDSSAATAEVLGGFFFDNEYVIDPESAQGLYVGIATDTGQFRFPATSRRVFQICGRLLELGADPALASNRLYEQESMGKLKLLQSYLGSLRMECDARVCIGVLSREIFERTGAGVEDTEGLVDYARSIHGVDIGVIIEDRGEEVKGSLRAKEARFRVNDLAARFGGGGHSCAAGFSSRMTMDTFYPKFLEALGEHFRAIEKEN